MAQVVISEEYLNDIAQALRVKLGTSESFKPSQMANGIRRLPTAPRVISKNITANGTYNASTDGADGYSPIAVNVANSYTQSDEGKVVNSGALVSQSSQTITQNGTYNTTLNNQIVANVPNTYAAGDEGKVVDNGALVAQTSKNINANGTHDTTKNNSVVVSVPNSYSASDEGKVVDNGALVAQTSQTITQNGTYDTTLKNEVVVNVSGGGGSGVVLSGTTTPTSAMGNDEDLYVKYGVMSVPPYDYTYKIDSIYRKVSGSWVAYTEPLLPTRGCHIWTKSTGGNDAAMYVQDGYWDVNDNQFVATAEVVSILYRTVQGGNTHNCNGIATLGYPSNWQVYATDTITDGTNTYTSGNQVKSWAYNASVDFYIWKPLS